MLVHDFAFGRHHIAFAGGQVFLQKFAEGAFADEADASAVFFGGGGQAGFGGNAAHFGFFQVAEREEGAFELGWLEAVEEVALVFVGIQAFEQIMLAVAHFFAGVVAGGDGFGALPDGVIQKAFEFDFGVAQHVGVGGAAGLVFLQEVGEYFVFVLGGEIDDVDVDADDVGHGDGVERILLDAAVFVVVVVFPVLHEHAAHLLPLLLEQVGGYGGIDAAGQADDDVLRGRHSVWFLGGAT